MEIEASAVAKKMWNIVRVVVMMMRKGVSKSKIMMELNLFIKRGKLAGKAMAENLILHSSASAGFSCRSNDAVSFISPREYEFSCSNSPAAAPLSFTRRRRRHRHHDTTDDLSTTVTAVQRMLEMYYSAPPEASPMVALPGFGKSPIVPVRQLRITDSPFPIKDDGLGDSQVDVKAEDFIKKFYKSLRQQKRTAYLESPYREVYA